MTNNPAKMVAMHDLGFEKVERVAVPANRNPHNEAYLEAKDGGWATYSRMWLATGCRVIGRAMIKIIALFNWTCVCEFVLVALTALTRRVRGTGVSGSVVVLVGVPFRRVPGCQMGFIYSAG